MFVVCTTVSLVMCLDVIFLKEHCYTFSTILGIEDAQINKELVNTEYFTLDGIKTNAKTNGVYIQKKTYKDGTQEVKKINR